MRCLVTASKHVKSTWTIARQLLDKRFPAATDTHAIVDVLSDFITGNCDFYVVRAEIL
jgi:hypothetical protein